MQSSHTSTTPDTHPFGPPTAHQDQQRLSLQARLSPTGLSSSVGGTAHAALQSALEDHQPVSPSEAGKNSPVSAGNITKLNRQQRRKESKAESRQLRQLEAEQRAREAAIKRSEARHKQKCMPFERRDDATGIMTAIRALSFSPQVGQEDVVREAPQGDLSKTVVAFKHPYKYGELLVPAPKSIDQEYIEQLTSERFRLSQALVEFQEGTPAYCDMDNQIEMRRVQLDMISQARLRHAHSPLSPPGPEERREGADSTQAAENDITPGQQRQREQPHCDALLAEEGVKAADASSVRTQSAQQGGSAAGGTKAQKNKRRNERKKAAARRAKEEKAKPQTSPLLSPTEQRTKFEGTECNTRLRDGSEPQSIDSHRLKRSSSFPAPATDVQKEEGTSLRHAKSDSFSQASAQGFHCENAQAFDTVSADYKLPSPDRGKLEESGKPPAPEANHDAPVVEQPQQTVFIAAQTVDNENLPTWASSTMAVSFDSASGLRDAEADSKALGTGHSKSCSPDPSETPEALVDGTIPNIDKVKFSSDGPGQAHDCSHQGSGRQNPSDSAASTSLPRGHRFNVPSDSEDDHNEEGLWVRGITGPCIHVQEGDVVFERSFSVYGHHVISLVLQKHHQAIVDHHTGEQKQGFLVLEGGFIVQLLNLEGRCEIIGYFPEGSPYHIPLSPLLAEEARCRAIHEELQLRQWLSRGSASHQEDSETDHGYSASEGSLSDEVEDDARRSEESLPHRRHRGVSTMQHSVQGDQRDSLEQQHCSRQQPCEEGVDPDVCDESAESQEYTDDCLQEGDEEHWYTHRELEVIRQGESRREDGPLQERRRQEPQRHPQRSPPAYKLPKKLQELKARLAAGKLAEKADPAPDHVRLTHEQLGRPARRSIEPSPGGQGAYTATSGVKFRIPSSRPAPPAPRLLGGDASQQKTAIIAEEAPLRKYAGINAASLPRHKFARSLRSRHFGVRLGHRQGRRQPEGAQIASMRRDRQQQHVPRRINERAAHEDFSAQNPVHIPAEHLNVQEATLRALQEALRRSMGLTSVDVHDRAPGSRRDATQECDPASSRVYEIESEDEDPLERAEGHGAKGDDDVAETRD